MAEETPQEYEVELITSRGMMGPDKDYLAESIIRAIAEWFGHPNDWPTKYGTHVENEWFMMHPFCWCEGEDCPWCREEDPLPNFLYKPLDFRVSWYKYIGRGMNYNKNLNYLELATMLNRCLYSRM